MLLKASKALSMASEGLVASFILLYLLIISTSSNGLVGITDLSSSDLVELSICNSSNKYSALRQFPFKRIRGVNKIKIAKNFGVEEF